jgi:hypothetical protein
VAARECLGFVLKPTAPDRTYGVDDVFRGQVSRWGGDCAAGRQTPLAGDDLSAGLQNRGTSGAMDGAVNAASAEEGRVSGIHDGVASDARDVARTLYDEQAVG